MSGSPLNANKVVFFIGEAAASTIDTVIVTKVDARVEVVLGEEGGRVARIVRDTGFVSEVMLASEISTRIEGEERRHTEEKTVDLASAPDGKRVGAGFELVAEPPCKVGNINFIRGQVT